MEPDEIVICTSSNVYVGQAVILCDRSLVGGRHSLRSGRVIAVERETRSFTVEITTMRGRRACTVWDQHHGDGLSYCLPAEGELGS